MHGNTLVKVGWRRDINNKLRCTYLHSGRGIVDAALLEEGELAVLVKEQRALDSGKRVGGAGHELGVDEFYTIAGKKTASMHEVGKKSLLHTLADLALALLDLLLDLERLRLKAQVNNLVLRALVEGDLLRLVGISNLWATVGNASALNLAVGKIPDVLSGESAGRLAEEESKGERGEARSCLLEVELGAHLSPACHASINLQCSANS